METGLLHDFLGIFSTRGEKYYFCMEGSTRDEIEPMRLNIKTNIKINIPAGRGRVGKMGRLGSGGQSGGAGGEGIPSPLSGIPSPYVVSHPINESPKWNS